MTPATSIYEFFIADGRSVVVFAKTWHEARSKVADTLKAVDHNESVDYEGYVITHYGVKLDRNQSNV